jgi:XTP/dITP diphosphohydrolase
VKLVLATRNNGKIAEIKGILSDLDIEILSAEDFDNFPDPEENGKTFLENALIKAKAVYKQTSIPALADDSGLEVDFLGGGPGIISARYGGGNLNDSEKYIKLLGEMRGVPEKERGARFRCVMALYPIPDFIGSDGDDSFPGSVLPYIEEVKSEAGDDMVGAASKRKNKGTPKALVTEGFVYGRISEKPMGKEGFGYDPVFYIPEAGMTVAQMSRKEKNRISHRYRALVEMKNLLVHYFGLDVKQD